MAWKYLPTSSGVKARRTTRPGCQVDALLPDGPRLLCRLRRIPSAHKGSCRRQCAYRRVIRRDIQSYRKADRFPRLKSSYIFSFWETTRASLLDVLCAGQPQTSLLYTISTRLVCARRSNYSRARAQLEFHILSQCGAISHATWAAIEWSWSLKSWTAKLAVQQQSRALESLCNTIHSKRCCSSCPRRGRRELRRARTKYFDARYVRDPQSSGTEVLGTANIDLWQRQLIIG